MLELIKLPFKIIFSIIMIFILLSAAIPFLIAVLFIKFFNWVMI